MNRKTIAKYFAWNFLIKNEISSIKFSTIFHRGFSIFIFFYGFSILLLFFGYLKHFFIQASMNSICEKLTRNEWDFCFSVFPFFEDFKDRLSFWDFKELFVRLRWIKKKFHRKNKLRTVYDVGIEQTIRFIKTIDLFNVYINNYLSKSNKIKSRHFQ